LDLDLRFAIYKETGCYQSVIRIPKSASFMGEAPRKRRLDTPAVAGVAVFSSLALILSGVSQAFGLNFPIIPYLQFDLGEVAILLAFFIFGPVPALASSFVEFAGLMVFGQQVPIGPLLKLFALLSTVAGLSVGAKLSSGVGEKRLGRLLGSSAAVGAVVRAMVMTGANYYLIVFYYGLAGIEGFLKSSFSLVGIGLTDANALAIILVFTAIFNAMQLFFVTMASYFVLKVPAVSRIKVAGRAPWFTMVLKGNSRVAEAL
jgi:riboflavin transporter FmnP